MKKSVADSFIISCEFDSLAFQRLNKAKNEYKGRSVMVIQSEVTDNSKLFTYELSYCYYMETKKEG